MARFLREKKPGLFFVLYIRPVRATFHTVRFQPNRDYISNDEIQTPPELAQRLVDHFKPSGRILEPSAGDGNFLKLLPGADWCEINRGRDFLEYQQQVDWIITNPPWSKIRPFLAHSFALSANVAFLMTVNHAWTKARLNFMYAHGFGMREIVIVPTPASFPQSGFQLGMVHYARGWTGDIKLTSWI